MTDEELQGKWFAKVTKPQLDAYNRAMFDALPYQNTPKWERMRQAAQRAFHEETQGARELYERSMADIAAMGEVSEATNYAMDLFEVGQIMQAAAE